MYVLVLIYCIVYNIILYTLDIYIYCETTPAARILTGLAGRRMAGEGEKRGKLIINATPLGMHSMSIFTVQLPPVSAPSLPPYASDFSNFPLQFLFFFIFFSPRLLRLLYLCQFLCSQSRSCEWDWDEEWEKESEKIVVGTRKNFVANISAFLSKNARWITFPFLCFIPCTQYKREQRKLKIIEEAK